MKLPSVQSFLFNGAGVAILVTVAGYMANSFFKIDQIPRCSERYPPGQQFSMQNSSGDIMSPIELQASLPSREWGLLRNARIVTAKDGQSHFLQVVLAATDDEEGTRTNGVGFVWKPERLEGARSACLSYKIFLSKDFKFEGDGYLPGLFGAPDLAALDVPQPEGGFVARLGWQKDGSVNVALNTAGVASGRWIGANSRAVWPLGTWVNVEQEVRLNEKGKSNGLLRVWFDGELQLDNGKLDFGVDDQVSLSGIVSDIRYLRGPVATSKLTVSPFLVQWQ
jgi:hypothetical protein